jgi:hypothetical protein
MQTPTVRLGGVTYRALRAYLARRPAGLADTAEWVVVATWPMNQHEEVIGWIPAAARVPEVVIRRRRCR